MLVQELNTRVISDSEYWNLFSRFNKNKAKKILSHPFLVNPESEEKLKEMILWCEINTFGLIYISIENYGGQTFGFGPPIGRFYFENKDDAMLFKLTWGGQ